LLSYTEYSSYQNRWWYCLRTPAVRCFVLIDVFFEYGKNPRRILSTTTMMEKKNKTKRQKTFLLFYEKIYGRSVYFLVNACVLLSIYIYMCVCVYYVFRCILRDRISSECSFVRRRYRIRIRYWTIWLMYVPVFTEDKMFGKKNRMKHVAFITPYSVVVESN